MVRQIKRKMDKRALNEARRKELRAALAAAIDADDLVEAKRLQAELIKLSPKDGQRSFSSKSECEDPYSLHLVEHYSRPDHLGHARTALDWLREFSKEIRADIGHHGLVPGVAAIVDKACADAGELIDDAAHKAIVRAVSIKIADRIQGIGMLFVERLNQAIRMLHALGPDTAKALGLPLVLPRFDAEKQDVWVKRNIKTAADYEQIFEEGWAKYLAQLEPVTAEGDEAALAPASAAATPGAETINEPEPADGSAAEPDSAAELEPEPEPAAEPEPEPVAPKPAKPRTVVMSDMLEDG